MAKMTIAGVTYEGTPEEIRDMIEAFGQISFEDEGDVAEGNPQYKTEKRRAEKGERIRIIDVDSPLETYKNGDEFIVRSSNAEHIYVKEHGALIFHEEYEVIIEETVELTPKTITHEGAEYTLVDREARAGDVVEFTSMQVYFTEGKAYGPVDGNLKVVDDEGDKLDVYMDYFGRTESTVHVYEKVANAFDKFPKGAKVRLISGGSMYPLNGTENGGEYVVKNNDREHDGTRKIDIGHAFALPEQLELVVDEPLKVGDKVEVIDGSKSRWDDLGTGTVGEITVIDEDYEQAYEVASEDDYDRFPAEALRKVEEGEETEGISKYPEDGDIVRSVEDYNSRVKKGRLGVVVKADGSNRPSADFGVGLPWYAPVEIVARAKDRVDTK